MGREPGECPCVGPSDEVADGPIEPHAAELDHGLSGLGWGVGDEQNIPVRGQYPAGVRGEVHGEVDVKLPGMWTPPKVA